MNSIVKSAPIKWKLLLCFFAGVLQMSDTFAAFEQREVVYVDPLVQDYQQLVSTLPDTTQIVVLDPKKNGFEQIAEHLAMQRNVNTIHLISHGQEGKVQAGNLWMSADNIADNKTSLSSIGSALGTSGEILLYGCQVAKNNKGQEFVGLLAAATGANVAASDDWTGDAQRGGDWQLETVIGAVQANILPINKSYPHLLNTINAGDMVVLGWNASNDTVTFATLVDLPAGTVIKITDWGWNATGDAFTGSTTGDGMIIWTTSSSVNAGTIFNLFLGGTGDAQTTTLTNITTSTDLTADIAITGYSVSDPMNLAGDSIFIYQDADNNPYFIFGINNSGGTNIDANNWNTPASFLLLRDSTLPGGAGSQNALINGTNAVGLPGGGSQQDNVQYTGPTTSADKATWLSRVANLSNWTGDAGATTTSVGTGGGSFMAISSPPVVTDGNISISGASGTGGAYKIGDTVTATWNNTAGGDNNAGITAVTVDFSQFGGGAAVAATDSANTWTASYTITAGAIDATNRNVSVTATNANGPTTTSDTSNATVDSQAPTVTNANISISGGTGTGGAYIIGNTVTATWNNTAGGDNNSDLITAVTVDFSQFGGGAAVAATNSSGTWTATYTITAGAIDATNRNVSVTATDNAGNTTTTADTTNATVDSVAPTVTDANISISGGTGSGGTYIIGDTVTATWNNTAGGDNNSDSISNVTFDFSQFGGGAAVAATNSANTWTASYTVAAGAIEASGRNVSVTATDNAGNATTRADTSNAAVDNAAPTVANVSVPANATYITGQNLDFTVNIAGLSDVVVNTTGGTPRIALTIGAATRYASFVSGSASPFLTFRYTVQADDLDADGIALAGVIEANGGTLQDGSGNDMNLTLNAVGSTASVLVDAVAPTISSVSVPAADTYLVGETLSFTVNTTENVTVSTGGGTPHLPLTIGATAREAVYVSGSSTSALVFSYTVQAGDNDGDGIAIGASAVLDGGTMRDAAGNDLTLTLNSVGDTTGVRVDTAAPTLQTLSPADDSATVAANANFVMTFSEDITLGAGDITFYDSLNVQVAVIDVASHGGQLSITGNELTINPTADLSESTSYYIHVDNGAVTDLAGIAYAGIGDSTSWNFTVADVTPPTVTSITVAGSPSASAEAIQFTVTFDEVPANISVSDFTLTPSGAGVSGNIASNSPVNLNTVTVTVDQITGTGTLRLDVNASSGITDTLGNGNGTNGFVPAFTSGDLHTVDREAPGVPTGLALDAASDSATPGDAITNDNTPTINGTADANVTIEVSSDLDGAIGTTTSNGSGGWSFTPGTALTDGAHNLTATAADAAGNESAASTPLTVEIDTTAPTAGIVVADTDLVTGETSLVTITFDEAITGFANEDLTIASGTLTDVSSSDGNVTWTATFTPANGVSAATNVISLNLAGVTDVAGNAGTGSENSANYAVDTLQPSATIVVADAELLTGETTSVTITFNEAVSDFTNDDLTVVNGSLTAVSTADSGVTWTATLTPTADTYVVDNVITLDNAGVTDAGGNAGSGTTDSNTYTVRTRALSLLVSSALDTGDDATTAATLADDEADGNGLSLREALFWARSNGDTVTFDLDNGTAGNQGGTITLNGTELAVNHNNLIIDGDLNDDGTPDITLSGNNVSRIMRVASGRTGIELVGLTLTQGAGNGGGGGLALDINTDTTLRDSTITDNHELGWGGGGIYGSTATLRIINSTISGNSSDSFGGGIRLVGNGALHLLNSTVSNNTTSGAGAHGAGIQYAGPDLLVVNTTISGNAAMGASAIGGGLRISSGAAAIYNTTIVGNAAGGSGGGVSANGTNDVFVNTVVAGNAAGAGSMAGVNGSPLATGGVAGDVAGTIEVATNSYFGTSATITTDNNSLNNQGTLNLLLGDLADNGGRVLTHRPTAGSALSDAGSTADLPADTYDLDGDTNMVEALPVDALGASRVSGAAVDIGAVEGNRAPELFDLSGGNTYIEDGVAVVMDNDITVTDDELDELNGGNGNYSGASLTIARNGGVDASDSFGFVDGSGMSLVAGEILKNGQAIATFDTATAGQLVVTYTDANGELPERSDVNAMMQQITYASTSSDPATNVVLDWTFADETGASVTGTASVTISLKNDAPTVTATGGTPTFTENGTAVDLFSVVSVDPVEAAQSIIGLQLTVTDVNNGSDEILAIDGSDVALTQGNILVTGTNALDVSVTVAGTTATVTLSHATGITGAAVQAIIDGMTYRNTSGNPSPLSRTVTLSSVQDNGGVANAGVDSTSVSIAATITISAVNNAPTISGTPLVTTNQSALYSFTPTASDLDSGTLTFSISNAPVWTSFDTNTGTLSGTPGQAHVGTVSGIVITVSDGALSASLPAFNLTVMNVNDAPVISGTPATSVDQDVAYSFVPTASDLDGDTLTFSAANLPAWASLNTSTGAITGTPDIDDVGEYANIVITVSDGTLTASLPAFTITVQNNAPVISGTPQLVAYVAAPYSFTPTASDGDNDTLSFTATGLPGWLFLNTATGQISGTPGVSDAGMSYNITLTVSDGINTATLPVFSLSVQYDGDEPVVTPPDEVTLNAVGLLTPVSLSQLLSLPPDTSAETLQDALRNLASDRTHGGACCITEPYGLQADQIMLAPGRHEVIWRATNQANLTGEAIQVVNVLPIISLNKDQVRGEGSAATLRVLLNGRSPQYPLTVGFTIDGTATGADHDLAVNSVTFAQDEIERQVQINLTDDGTPEGNETLIISLDESTTDAGLANFGNKRVHEIQIVEENVAPLLRLSVQQNSEDRRIITQDGGVVQISATVDDPNPADTHLYDWQYPNGLVVTPVTDASGTFDPATLEPGTYEVTLIVTEDNMAPLMTSESVIFQVMASAPALGTEDSDNDSIDDATEGLADSDGDGQPDYIDSIDLPNVLNETRDDEGRFLVEGDPGLRLELGTWSLLDDSDGAHVSRQTLTAGGVPVDSVPNVGGYFDFVVRDIPAHGSSVRIVLPQRVSVPTSPVYRKFGQGVWFDFVEDARNQLESAAGSEGVCPPPGSDEYSAGLSTGHWCVQLTIEDGGPNDTDGEANGTVVDPGGVAGKSSAQNVVEHKTRGGGGGSGGSLGLAMMAMLLLLVLARLQRARRPAAGLVVLLAISTNVNAQGADVRPWDALYLQGGIAYAHSNLSRSDAERRLGGADDGIHVTDMDDRRMAWNLGLGYSFSERWALELSYLDLGEVEMTLDAPITAEQMAQIHPESGKGWTLSGIYLHPLRQQLWLQARLGLFNWEQDYETVRGSEQVDRFSDSGTDLLWGLGVAYQLGDNTTITGEMQGIDFDRDLNLSIGAGLRFWFN